MVEESNFVGRLEPQTGKIRLQRVPTPHAVPYGIVVSSTGAPTAEEEMMLPPELRLPLNQISTPEEGTPALALFRINIRGRTSLSPDGSATSQGCREGSALGHRHTTARSWDSAALHAFRHHIQVRWHGENLFRYR
jgi:hypothetical protein